MSDTKRIFVGTAGWAISAAREAVPDEGTALERYARVFDGVEINSSFHRRHRPATWARWADSTPEQFRFAVKLPKTITHQAKLVEADDLLDEFADDVGGLGIKLGVVLVQMPPSLGFDPGLVEPFFDALAKRVAAPVACEPRHVTWFEPGADDLLRRMAIARVAADPAIDDVAAIPGGARGLAYWRLHGSPRMYRSAYGETRVVDYAAQIRSVVADQCWCMFDNTASSAAIGDALLMNKAIG